MDNLPDWLNQLQVKSSEPETTSPETKRESVPDWLSGFGSELGMPVDGQCLLGVVFTANDSVEFIAEDTLATETIQLNLSTKLSGASNKWLAQSKTLKRLVSHTPSTICRG